MKPEVLQV